MTIETSDQSNYPLWVEAMETFQVPPDRRGVPMLFIGDTVLVGSRESPEQLPGLIEHHLAAGGVDYPTIPGLGAFLEVTPAPSVEPAPTQTKTPPEPEEQPPIHLAYFYQAGCQECDRVQLALDCLENQYPQLSICTFDVRERAALNEWPGEQAGVPVGKWLTAPAVFVGDEALVGDDLHSRSLEELIARHVETGAGPICQSDLYGT